MWDGLIATKFAAPPARFDLIERPRLIERIDSAPAVSLTAVVAPAGAGKSTLLADWYRALSQRQQAVAWVSLDSDDDKPVRFLSYVFAAINQANSRIGASAVALLRNVPILDTEILLPLLVNDLAADEQRLSLFIDDLHVITDRAILSFLDKLLTYAPRNFSLYVASRQQPPLSLGRLRLRNQFALVTQEDLRFDLAETDAFLNATRHLELSPEELRLLHGRTEGWAAGLRLASLSLEGRSDRHGFLHSFSGNLRSVADFLAHDVLAQQPTEVQEFLLRTAVLTRFDAPLAHHVTGRSDSAAMIERLYRANLFLVPLDSDGRWFRYHHLFADFLRTRLDQVSPGLSQTLHRMAGAWHEARDDVGTALHHALAIGDCEWAATMVEEKGMRFARYGQLNLVRDWLSALPEQQVQQRPLLHLIVVWISVHMVGQRQGLRHLRQARQMLNAAGIALSRDLAVDLRVMAAGVVSAADHSRWALAMSLRELKETPAEHAYALGCFCNTGAFSAHALGQLDLARSLAEQGRDWHNRAGVVFGVIYSDMLQAMTETSAGRARAAESRLRQAITLAQEGLEAPAYARAMMEVQLGELAYERGDIDTASRLLHENRYIIDGTALIVHAIVGYVTLARLEVLAGRRDAALAILDGAERIGRERLYRRLRAAVLNERVRLLLAEGDLAAAQEALNASRLVHPLLLEESKPAKLDYIPQDELAQVAQARVLIAEQRYDRALRLLDVLSQRMEAEGRGLNLVQVRCLKAIALARGGRAAAAQDCLRRTLAAVEGEGLLRSIADEGRALKPLLTALLARASAFGDSRPTPGYLQRLLAAIAPSRPLPKPAIEPPEAHLSEALSARELDIVRLLARGCSNDQLAEALSLSSSTVKWHLKNIFGKLGVRSRTQAVLAAQQLQLLA